MGPVASAVLIMLDLGVGIRVLSASSLCRVVGGRSVLLPPASQLCLPASPPV